MAYDIWLYPKMNPKWYGWLSYSKRFFGFSLCATRLCGIITSMIPMVKSAFLNDDNVNFIDLLTEKMRCYYIFSVSFSSLSLLIGTAPISSQTRPPARLDIAAM